MRHLALILSITLSTFALSAAIQTEEELVDKWQSTMRSSKLFSKLTNEQFFCFGASPDGNHNNIYGNNLDEPARLASVSKLFTSMALADSYHVGDTYETIVYADTNTINYDYQSESSEPKSVSLDIHLKGDLNPYFNRDRFFQFIYSLQSKLATESIVDKRPTYNPSLKIILDKVTYDKNFIPVTDKLKSYSDFEKTDFQSINKTIVKSLSTVNWDQNTFTHYKKFLRKYLSKSSAYSENLVHSFSRPNIEVKSASYTSESISTAEFIINLNSSEPSEYIKYLNATSNNHLAEMMWLKAKKKMNYPMDGRYDYDGAKLYTGSGLNKGYGKNRVDNTASCRDIIKVLYKVKEQVTQRYKEQYSHISDILANMGKDSSTLASFRSITFGELNFDRADFKSANKILKGDRAKFIYAKTGTLYHTKTLAGFIDTERGLLPFAILNHRPTSDYSNSKNIFQKASKAYQVYILNKMIDLYGTNQYPTNNSSYSPTQFKSYKHKL